MNKFRKVFISFLLTLCLLDGCKNDDLHLTSCVLKKALIEYPDSHAECNYYYSDKLILASGKVSFTYSGGTLSTTLTTNDQGFIIKTVDDANAGNKTEYTLNTNSQIEEALSYGSEILFTKRVYTYNSSGQLTKLETFEYYAGVPHRTIYETYEYESETSGNPVTVKTYLNDGTLSRTYSFKYDNKKNPANQQQLSDITFGIKSSVNNATKVVLIMHLANRTITSEAAYKYNEAGYPTKVQVTTTEGSQTNNYSFTYSYDCQ